MRAVIRQHEESRYTPSARDASLLVHVAQAARFERERALSALETSDDLARFESALQRGLDAGRELDAGRAQLAARPQGLGARLEAGREPGVAGLALYSLGQSHCAEE